MSDPIRPHEVFKALIAGIAGKDWEKLPDLYAEDAVVEHPFALPQPLRLDGREAVRRHFAAAVNLPLEMRARDIVVHESTDPEVIVAEYVNDGRITTTGRTFSFANVLVMRIRNGLIVTSRDYHNHLALADVPEIAALRANTQSAPSA